MTSNCRVRILQLMGSVWLADDLTVKSNVDSKDLRESHRRYSYQKWNGWKKSPQEMIFRLVFIAMHVVAAIGSLSAGVSQHLSC